MREMIERAKREADRESRAKYLQLTDLSKWITCPVRAAGASRRVERGNEQQGERERCF